MKNIAGSTVVIFFILVLIISIFSTKAFASDNATSKNQIVIGKLVCDANPCTTDPCLPGVIMLIETLNGNLHELTMQGSWIWDCFFEWKGFSFEDGDYVILVGQEFDSELEIKFIYKFSFMKLILN